MIDFFPTREIALSVLNFQVHWYGLLYLFAFWLAYFLLPRLAHWRKLELSKDDWASILAWAVVGVIVGGRLGYAVLYEPVYFFQHPLDVLKVWEGGMSSHGGFVGVIAALSYVVWQKDLPLRAFADVVVVPAALGLALGRFGNFINQELYGTVSTLPWAIEFTGVEGARHPLQIYGVIQNILIAAACYWSLRKKPIHPGRTFALFLILYSVSRFLLEFIRAQQHTVFEFGMFTLTRGQLYTLPLLAFGLWFWWLSGRGRNSDDARA